MKINKCFISRSTTPKWVSWILSLLELSLATTSWNWWNTAEIMLYVKIRHILFYFLYLNFAGIFPIVWTQFFTFAVENIWCIKFSSKHGSNVFTTKFNASDVNYSWLLNSTWRSQLIMTKQFLLQKHRCTLHCPPS